MREKKKLGRPERYDKEEMAKSLIEYFKSRPFHEADGKEAGDMPTLEGWCREMDIGPDKITRYSEQSDIFRQAVTQCKGIQKDFIQRHAMKNKYNAQFAMFYLKSVHKMYDKPDHEEVDLTKVSSTDLDVLKEKIEIILAERKNANTPK